VYNQPHATPMFTKACTLGMQKRTSCAHLSCKCCRVQALLERRAVGVAEPGPAPVTQVVPEGVLERRKQRNPRDQAQPGAGDDAPDPDYG
jgi:hypothetical protein